MRGARGAQPGWSSLQQIPKPARPKARDKAARRDTAFRRWMRRIRAIPPLIFRAIRQARAVSLKASFHINMRECEHTKHTASAGSRSQAQVCHNRTMTQPARDIQRAELPNGVVVVTEKMPHVRSVSVGIWLASGSRAESRERNGIAHFIEHMVFKGTHRRTAEQIAQSVDSVGGMLDAFTAKEMTCFNAKVLDEHLPVAVDVLSDLVLHPRFDADDIAKEKQVVLEEIKMEEDNPEYLIHELFTQNFWRGHPLGMPILGNPESVSQFSKTAVRECFEEWYAPNRVVITAAGNLEHARLVDLVAHAFGDAARSAISAKTTTPQTNAF